MALVTINKRAIRLVKGCGYMRYKAVDRDGEPITTVSLVWRFNQRIMFGYTREGWYDGVKTNKLRFTRRGRTLYLKRLCIRLIKQEEGDE